MELEGFSVREEVGGEVGWPGWITVHLFVHPLNRRKCSCRGPRWGFRVGCSLLLMIVYQAKRSNHTAGVALFLIICFLVFFSVPLNLVASKSLLTKITRPETQGFTQGVYSSVSRIALIFGPLLGSSAFHSLALFGSLMALGNVVSFVWLLLCLNRIKLRIQARAS